LGVTSIFASSGACLAFMKLLLALAATIVLAFVVSIGHYANEVRLARAETPELVAQAWARHGKKLSLRGLSSERLDFLLAVEDPAFFRHRGVDLKTPGAGMTTISQGLVKMLYFPGGFRPGIAKVRQTLIAQYAFDASVSKQEQLELFLNVAYMGGSSEGPVYGFSAAARRYFEKEFAALSDAEFEALVAMVIGPNTYVPGSAQHAARVKHIEAYVSGKYRPLCVLDTEYDGKTRGTLAEEAFMVVLRLLTDASPEQRQSSSRSDARPFVAPERLQRASPASAIG
jgi:membrane carboxypeptidase/penicillin-binding protein